MTNFFRLNSPLHQPHGHGLLHPQRLFIQFLPGNIQRPANLQKSAPCQLTWEFTVADKQRNKGSAFRLTRKAFTGPRTSSFIRRFSSCLMNCVQQLPPGAAQRVTGRPWCLAARVQGLRLSARSARFTPGTRAQAAGSP